MGVVGWHLWFQQGFRSLDRVLQLNRLPLFKTVVNGGVK